MRVQFTQYDVPGWGVGDLWTGGGLLLTHEFRFGATERAAETLHENGHGSGTSRGDSSEPRPPMGAHSSLAGTVSGKSARVGDDFAPASQQPHAARARAATVRRLPDPDELVARFSAFFAGRDVAFDDVPLDLEWATPFQHSVATVLRAVPRGEIVSYGELAAIAGYPGAARAAGSFCAHNRFMLVVPCHRVVGAQGLGGYGSAGVDTKRRLLALEGVAV